jgi:AcrR family transcriptional regulator
MGKKAEKTRQIIIEAAFKNFAVDSYNNVSLKRIEEKAGLSRGALLYHFPTKEQIFTAVVDQFVVHSLSVTSINKNEIQFFSDFIDAYLVKLTVLQKKFQSLGIPNMAFGLVNLNMESFHYYKNFREIASAWNQSEDRTWLHQLEKAIKKNEIRHDIEIEKVAKSFKNLFYGTAYESLNSYTDDFLDMLKWQYYFLYNSLK